MKIQITEDYVMTSDAHNFILNEVSIAQTGKKAGQQRLAPIGYYSRVSDLVDGLISLKMKRSTKRTMESFIKEHRALVDEIRKVFQIERTPELCSTAGGHA